MELTPDTIALAALWYVVFVFSTTCHEAAHALASYRLGDATAYHGGQVTLNPLPHIARSPFGMIVIPLISFAWMGWMIGWASAPYDPAWALRYPKRSALMALAGPASNLAILLAAGIGLRAGMEIGIFEPPAPNQALSLSGVVEGTGDWGALATLLSIAFTLNLLLFIFNLLPVPPLDGSGALPLFLSDNAARKYLGFLFSQPMVAWVGILVAWRAFGYIFYPVWSVALKVLFAGIGTVV